MNKDALNTSLKWTKCKGKFKGTSGTKGFSLVELIVVIAILAVLASLIAPSLLSYVERSRATNDISAMSEVVNAAELAMSDSDCYDEIANFNTKNNVSCYVDTNKEGNYEKIITQKGINGEKDQYTFGDNSRLLDETQYFAAGNMRGVTITFSPDFDNTTLTYDLSNGVVNQFKGETSDLISLTNFYNMLRSTVGDVIKLSSQTYRNSDFTIFIVIGTTGGNQADAQNAIKVYGQFSGTNLTQDSGDRNQCSSSAVVHSNAVHISNSPVNFEFEDGMTWAEWVNSPYNTIGLTISNGIISLGTEGELKGDFNYRVEVNDIIDKNIGYAINWDSPIG